MTNKILNFFKCVGTCLGELFSSFKQETKKTEEYFKRSHQAQEKQKLNRCVLIMMDGMTRDLFEVFHHHDYGLAPINIATDIRIENYRCINNQYRYYFRLDKKTCDTLPQWKQRSIIQKINKDIASTQRNLQYLFPSHELQQKFPFLSSGIIVTNIADNGSPEVIITVETYLTPQTFYQIIMQISSVPYI